MRSSLSKATNSEWRRSFPDLFDNSTRVIYLDHNDSMIDITGKVPYPGHYVFVVHYFQPDHPEFNMDVLIHNGQVYEAKLPVQHCPSNSGCRSIVKQQDGNTPFYLTENFVFTLKLSSHSSKLSAFVDLCQEPNRRGVWVDYLLVIPAEQFTDRILREEPIDHTGRFINQCGKNHFYVDNTTDGMYLLYVNTICLNVRVGGADNKCACERRRMKANEERKIDEDERTDNSTCARERIRID
ncbi:unnamed protein product [Timema podura]|uniref:Uncharacterized protein n=1 Tax=Timema podura TaxID=61482 RepID=A0ABN7NF46_TIMPD|nr:unnamed protein product [Timema podura]